MLHARQLIPRGGGGGGERLKDSYMTPVQVRFSNNCSPPPPLLFFFLFLFVIEYVLTNLCHQVVTTGTYKSRIRFLAQQLLAAMGKCNTPVAKFFLFFFLSHLTVQQAAYTFSPRPEFTVGILSCSTARVLYPK